MSTHDVPLSARFRAECRKAREHLARAMEQQGLHRHEGWSITESVRATARGTSIVFRPMHMRLACPAGLECEVEIDVAALNVEAECEPPLDEPRAA